VRSTHRAHSRPVTQRRKLVWATSTQSALSVGAGLNRPVDLLANFELAGASTLGVTIMRTHIRGAYSATQTVGTQLSSWTIGLIIGRDSDLTTPAVVSPATEPELDWMYLSQQWNDTSAAVYNASQPFVLDIRSKRKMEEMGQRYLFCLFNPGVAAADYSFFARTLVALP
jgi:hypothetical protein